MLHKRQWFQLVVSILVLTLSGCVTETVPKPDIIAGSRQSVMLKPPPLDFSKREALPYKMTLAVMSLENLTKRQDLDWLSAGIPESMVSKLQNVRALRMVERIRIKHALDEIGFGVSGLVSQDTAQQAGKMLGADTVVIGSFSEFQGTVRINVRLLKVESGVILQATESTGLMNRIFQLQDRLSEQLVRILGVGLREDEQQRLTWEETNSIQAYENYVRGRDYYFQFNRAGYEKAVELYREAIRQDPNFALAYAGIADSLATLAYSRKREGSAYESLFREANEAAKKAIALNPNLSDGYRALAHVYNNELLFVDANREAKRALTLNPNDAEAWYILAQTATARNFAAVYDLDKAEIYYENAIKLNPDYAMAYNSLGWYVYLEKKWHDKAAEVFQRAIQISPDFTDAYDSLGEAYFRMNKYEEAAKNFKKALELQSSHKHAAKRYQEVLKKLKP